MEKNLIDLEIALQEYNDSLDQVLVTSPEIQQELAEMANIDDLDEPDNLADYLAQGNYTWTANYLPVQPERRRTLADVSGSSRLIALAWLAQAALYSILIIGML
jgi:hypothetical protein